MDSCAVNSKLLLELLNKEIAGQPLTRLEVSRSLKAGLSGSSVWLIHLSDRERFRFGVLKIPGHNKEDDVERDSQGCGLMRSFWPDALIAHSFPLVRHPDLISDRPDTPLLVMRFADENSTEKPRPLSEVVRSDTRLAHACVKNLVDSYAERISWAYQQDLEGADAPPIVARSPLDHMKSILHPNLMKKIQEFPWHIVGIPSEQPFHRVNFRITPNPLYIMSNKDAWLVDRLRFPHVPIHGDLNLDNVISLGSDAFVLIDFEKARVALPQYDLAFLFMWLIKELRLESISAASDKDDEDLSLLAERLGQAFEDNDNESLNALGHKDHTLAWFAEILFLPMRKMVPDNLCPEEFQRKGGSLSLAMAALARSFYEFRYSLSSENRNPRLSEMFGRFYYDFASCILSDYRMIKKERISRVRYGSSRSSLPVANVLDSSRLEVDKSTELSREMGGSDSGEADPLALTISSGAGPLPSFFTKLVFTIPFSLSEEKLILLSWNRFKKANDHFGYFSRLEIETNHDFRQGTEDILVWPLDEKGIRLPLLYTLDLNILGNRRWLTGMDASLGPLELQQIDLVPLLGGRKAAIGLLFAGGECLWGDYLKWVSSRTFTGLSLTRRHPRDGEPSLFLGGVVKEIESALNEDRRPEAQNMTKSESLGEAKICQYLLVGHDAEQWSDIDDNPAFAEAWELVRTISRLSPEYPKYSRGDGRGQWTWSHPQAPGTRYGIFEKGITAVAHAADRFNRETKPRVFSRANYLQWILADELARKGKERADGIISCYTEDVRRLFVEQCLAFFFSCRERRPFSG